MISKNILELATSKTPSGSLDHATSERYQKRKSDHQNCLGAAAEINPSTRVRRAQDYETKRTETDKDQKSPES